MKRKVELALVTLSALVAIAFGMYSEPAHTPKTLTQKEETAPNDDDLWVPDLVTSITWTEDPGCPNRD